MSILERIKEVIEEYNLVNFRNLNEGYYNCHEGN